MEVKPALKSRSQEKMYHDLIGDIAEQWKYAGQLWDAEDMKRYLIAGFKYDTKDDPEFKELWAEMGEMRFGPCIRGGGIVMLGTPSRNFPKKLASAFIEWLYALGAEVGVTFKERT